MWIGFYGGFRMRTTLSHASTTFTTTLLKLSVVPVGVRKGLDTPVCLHPSKSTLRSRPWVGRLSTSEGSTQGGKPLPNDL